MEEAGRHGSLDDTSQLDGCAIDPDGEVTSVRLRGADVQTFMSYVIEPFHMLQRLVLATCSHIEGSLRDVAVSVHPSSRPVSSREFYFIVP